MKDLRVRPFYEKHDIELAQRKLEEELENLARVHLVVRGESPEILQLMERAEELMECMGWRETVWARDARILGAKREAGWFGSDSGACGVFLNFKVEPVGFLYSNSSRYEIEMMFIKAMSKRSGGERLDAIMQARTQRQRLQCEI
jgi:hypothetical protein